MKHSDSRSGYKMKNRQIVEIIGLLSVIGSLIFVGFEINQNTAAIRGATQQEGQRSGTQKHQIHQVQCLVW